MVAMWGYGLLGPVEARVDDRPVPLAGARQRLVLAMLLLGAGQLIPASRLIDELWGEALPEDPPGALRTLVSRLRRALGPAGAGITATGGGYRLSVRRDQLDAARFEDALARAGQVVAEEALPVLDDALGLWRGPALAEFAGRPFAQAEALRLDELRVTARERRAQLLLSHGSPADAIATLRAIVADFPERERPRSLLMQALYRDGRHTDALAAFGSWRRYLSEELGLDPSPELRRMEQDILRHSLQPAEPGVAAATRALPLPVTSFIGRDADCAAVTGLLGQARLLTLHGPGGVGKTRLALEVISQVGHRYADGAYVCDLAAISRPTAVTQAIAACAGIRERAFQRLDDQLVAHFAGRRLLLMLDNCEHVAAGVAAIAERLLRETRNVTVLATSRDRLRIDGEHIWQVRPLPSDSPGAPAVRLFLDRARAADPAAREDPPDATAVAALCTRLDGLPLAIELAAARLPGTTVGELAASLHDRFRLLAIAHRGGRHESLQAVVDWSYHLLTPDEQRLFAQLSVFHGWFDIGAASAVTTGPDGGPGAARAVLHLTDRSLITVGRMGDGTRYRLLETLRGYGTDRLAERGELAAARSRHARWAAGLVTQAAAGLQGADEARWAAALDSHLGDLRAAHAWLTGNDAALGLRMTADLHWYALLRCQSEVFRWADVSAAAAAGARSPHFAEALASAAFGAIYRGDLDGGAAAAHAALAAARGQDPAIARRSLEALGDVAIFGGDPMRAADLYRQAYDLAIADGDYRGAAWDAASAAAACSYGDQPAPATVLADQAQAAAAASGAPSALAMAAWAIGEITAATDPGQARQHLLRAAAQAATVGSHLVAGLAEVSLAALHARDGDAATALGYYRRVIRQWQQAGAWTPQWVTLRTLVDLLDRVGACHDAATLYGGVVSASTGAPPYGADAERLDQTVARLRETLPAAEFRACVGEGQRLDADQVIDFALDAIARASAS